MSQNGRRSTSDPAKDEIHLPRHIIVLMIVVFLAIVGAVAAFAFNSFNKPAVVPQTTPLVQHTATAKSTVHASPTAGKSPTTKPTPKPTPSPTVITQPDPYPPHTGTLVLSDPLKDNSKGYRWDVGTFAKGGNCTFAGGSYHVAISTRGQIFACNAENGNFVNFAYEVQMTIIKGDRGGLFFRQAGSQGPVYYFSIKTDGSYELDIFTPGASHVLLHGTSRVIKTGLNQANLLAVVAQGNNITLYVNRQSIAHATDSTTSHGLIGVAADATDQPAEVAFMNANVWML